MQNSNGLASLDITYQEIDGVTQTNLKMCLDENPGEIRLAHLSLKDSDRKVHFFSDATAVSLMLIAENS